MPSLPLFPDSGPAPLVGIARLAAHADPLREGHSIEYLSLPARSLLSRVTSGRRLPFQWGINPYRGCEFACKYCYARYTHEFMELRDPLAFEQKIYVKEQAAWLLRQDLRKVRPGEGIALGTATDPYQPAERRYHVTRAILEEFARHRGLRLGIITKSDLILRDADLLRQVAQHNSLHVSLTVTTLNTQLARILEPRAPRPDLRLEAVHKLNLAGIPTGVNCAPLLPGITDAPSDLSALVLAAKKANATSIFAGPLFLKPCAAAVFLPFLEVEFPHLVETYRKRYANSAFLPPDYGKRVRRLLAALRETHGMNPTPHPDTRFGERNSGTGLFVQGSLF
jgi:DNA repair photolyase